MGEFGDGPNFLPARQIFPIGQELFHAAKDRRGGMQFVEGDGGIVLKEICRGFLLAEGTNEGAANHG